MQKYLIYYMLFMININVWFQRLYINTARQLKRIDAVRKSPVFSHYEESVAGATSIRAYGKVEEFIEKSDKLTDESQRAWYLVYVSARYYDYAFRIPSYVSRIWIDKPTPDLLCSFKWTLCSKYTHIYFHLSLYKYPPYEIRLQIYIGTHLIFITRWLSITLESLGSLVIFSATLLALRNEGEDDSGTAGLSISYSLQV